MDVQEAADFSKLVFFQIGAESYSYAAENKLAWGNEEGLKVEWNASWGGNAYKKGPFLFSGRVPWVSLHDSPSLASHDVDDFRTANRGYIIRSWKSRLGGEDNVPPYAAEYGADGNPARRITSLMDITTPPGLTRLLPDDYVEAEIVHVVIPKYAADYYGPNENLRSALNQHQNTGEMVFREAVGNDLEVEVISGQLERRYSIRIRAETGNTAHFRITGGLGYVPLTITGVTGYRDPVLEENVNDVWRVVDQSNHGKDFWQTDYVPLTDSWEITYNINLDSPGDARLTREFRFNTTDVSTGTDQLLKGSQEPTGSAVIYSLTGRKRFECGENKDCISAGHWKQQVPHAGIYIMKVLHNGEYRFSKMILTK
jgi:hypothetical protein